MVTEQPDDAYADGPDPTQLGVGPPGLPPRPDARPRIVDEPDLLGFSRRTRSRLGSRLFFLFFAFVFTLIVVQMIVALLTY